jgi:hypothetical protein
MIQLDTDYSERKRPIYKITQGKLRNEENIVSMTHVLDKLSSIFDVKNGVIRFKMIAFTIIIHQ